MAVRGVIFDVDGTLVDTNATHVKAWRRAFERHGYDVEPDRIVGQIGKGGDKLVPTLLGDAAEAKDGDALRDAHSENYAELVRDTPLHLFPGAVELLESLKKAGIPTALATSSKREHLDNTLRAAGVDLGEKVDAVATADDADASKPAPDLVQSAADKLGLPPGDCVLVGDTVYDVEAAARAGVACWAVACGGCFDAAALRAAGAVAVFTDPADILAHREELGLTGKTGSG